MVLGLGFKVRLVLGFRVSLGVEYILVPNHWNQTMCLVSSPSIKKRGESVGWLPEEGKDGIMTSLSLPYSHAENKINVTNLIKQFIWTVFLPLQTITVHYSTFFILIY